MGTLRTKKDLEGNRKSYIVFDSNVRIFVGDEEVDLGKFRTVRLQDPFTGLHKAITSVAYDESKVAKIQQQIDGYAERNVKYTLVVPPQD